MGDIISFNRPDGTSCNGYLSNPERGENAPGVVVIQEWWGLNDQIKGVADQYASAGYRALVPDLYRGKVTLEMAEAEHLMGSLDFGDAATQDIRGAARYLRGTSPKVGVTGFCMGGALTVLAAMYVPEVDAAVSWYGIPPAEAGDTKTIQVPFQGHFAIQDQAFPISMADDLESNLNQASATFEIHRYDADHAFGNETGPNHDPEAKALAWKRTLEFFGTHLG